MRVHYEDPDLEGGELDANGDIRFYYLGTPFTGIVEFYDGNTLTAEFENDNGFSWGLQKEYYSNGMPKSEYSIGTGGVHGRWRRWDINGTVIYDEIWVNGEPSP